MHCDECERLLLSTTANEFFCTTGLAVDSPAVIIITSSCPICINIQLASKALLQCSCAHTNYRLEVGFSFIETYIVFL